MDQLVGYIRRSLGEPSWTVELSNAQAADAVQDALSMYSQWRPQIRIQALQMVRTVNRYLADVDCGQGVVKVDFAEPLPSPTAIFYGNLIDPAPLFRTGLDDYDMFLRWRKTWMRVTSTQPDWYYDDFEQVLYIHNPIERYHAAVYCYFNYDKTENLPTFGADWVKRYALAKAQLTYGEILSKYSGAIPGPVQNLTLDQQKRQLALDKIKELEDALFKAQLSSPISVD